MAISTGSYISYRPYETVRNFHRPIRGKDFIRKWLHRFDLMQPPPYIGSPDNPKTAGVVCYITIIGWLIAYFALYKDNKNDVAAFHLRQTLVLHLLSFILNLLSMFFFGPRFPLIIVAVLSLLLFIMWLIGLYGAVKGEKKAVPIIGQWSQTVFSNL